MAKPQCIRNFIEAYLLFFLNFALVVLPRSVWLHFRMLFSLFFVLDKPFLRDMPQTHFGDSETEKTLVQRSNHLQTELQPEPELQTNSNMDSCCSSETDACVQKEAVKTSAKFGPFFLTLRTSTLPDPSVNQQKKSTFSRCTFCSERCMRLIRELKSHSNMAFFVCQTPLSCASDTSGHGICPYLPLPLSRTSAFLT